MQQLRGLRTELAEMGEISALALAANRVTIKLHRPLNVVAATALCVSAAGCRTKTEPTAAPSAQVYGLAANERVAPECKRYAQQLLKCVADNHFPAQEKDAEKSALAQMMDGMKLDDVAPEARAQALSDAGERCEDALNTLRESSKTSCPGVL